jgi:hypothetical protein
LGWVYYIIVGAMIWQLEGSRRALMPPAARRNFAFVLNQVAQRDGETPGFAASKSGVTKGG